MKMQAAAEEKRRDDAKLQQLIESHNEKLQEIPITKLTLNNSSNVPTTSTAKAGLNTTITKGTGVSAALATAVRSEPQQPSNADS